MIGKISLDYISHINVLDCLFWHMFLLQSHQWWSFQTLLLYLIQHLKNCFFPSFTEWNRKWKGNTVHGCYNLQIDGSIFFILRRINITLVYVFCAGRDIAIAEWWNQLFFEGQKRECSIVFCISINWHANLGGKDSDFQHDDFH